jgi:SET domain-containing protein
MKRKPRVSGIGKRLIKDLEENIYCRLQPSKVHGIGIFAIRNIPKGKEVFKTFLNYELTPVPISLINVDRKIDPAVRSFANDMFPLHSGKLYMYRRGLNAIDIGFFLNHSTKPNVRIDDMSRCFAARNIKKGEELFANYKEYSEHPTP